MATRALAKYFDVAIGSDAGESMIRVAEELSGGETGGEMAAKIRWVVCPAEEVDEGIDGVDIGSVDLVSAAYAVSYCSFVFDFFCVYVLCLGFWLF